MPAFFFSSVGVDAPNDNSACSSFACLIFFISITVARCAFRVPMLSERWGGGDGATDERFDMLLLLVLALARERLIPEQQRAADSPDSDAMSAVPCEVHVRVHNATCWVVLGGDVGIGNPFRYNPAVYFWCRLRTVHVQYEDNTITVRTSTTVL